MNMRYLKERKRKYSIEFLLNNDASWPSINSFGSLNSFGSIIPFRIVSDTFAPIKIDPSISNIVARIHACRNVNTLLPTLVPNELATSFAQIPNAMIKATIKPRIKIHKTLIEYGSNGTIILFVYPKRIIKRKLNFLGF